MRYRIGEQIIIFTTLYNEQGNVVTGATITAEMEKPNGVSAGPFLSTESSSFPGIYKIEIPSQELDQLGNYIVRTLSTGYSPEFTTFFLGQSGGGGGGGIGAYKLSIDCKDQYNHIISDALVSIRIGNTIISSLLTDVSGHAEFNLEAGTYNVLVYKAGYSFEKYTFTINNDVTATITGSILSLPPAENPELCRVYIRTVDLGLGAVSGVEININYDVPEEIGTNLGIDKWTKVITDNNGVAYFDAPKGSNVLVRVHKASVNVKVKIPDKDSVYLTDLFEFT